MPRFGDAAPSWRVHVGRTHSRAGLYAGAPLRQLRSFGDVHRTHEFKNVRQVIDHALASRHLHDHSARRLWAFQDTRFFNDHVAGDDGNASDHGQVRAAFRWLPAPS